MTEYFTHIAPLHRLLILAAGIAILWMLENALPLFQFKYDKWKHARTNLLLTTTSLVINLCFALLIVIASGWCVTRKWGLLQWAAFPLWLQVITGLLLLDLIGAYSIHWIEHKIQWMWRFHMVHHTDLQVDTTTATRHHPGESVFRAVFTVVAVLIIGAPLWLAMLYQSLSAALSQFSHANIKIPESMDRILRLIIVSPNMHKVHHHYKRPETDTNYGNIFSCWDRLFGTFHYLPMAQLQYGLDVVDQTDDGSLSEQLLIPFENHPRKNEQSLWNRAWID